MPSPFRLLAMMAIAGSLAAANRSISKATVPYNIPLWEEGKVPMATGNGPSYRVDMSQHTRAVLKRLHRDAATNLSSWVGVYSTCPKIPLVLSV